MHDGVATKPALALTPDGHREERQQRDHHRDQHDREHHRGRSVRERSTCDEFCDLPDNRYSPVLQSYDFRWYPGEAGLETGQLANDPR